MRFFVFIYYFLLRTKKKLLEKQNRLQLLNIKEFSTRYRGPSKNSE